MTCFPIRKYPSYILGNSLPIENGIILPTKYINKKTINEDNLLPEGLMSLGFEKPRASDNLTIIARVSLISNSILLKQTTVNISKYINFYAHKNLAKEIIE